MHKNFYCATLASTVSLILKNIRVDLPGLKWAVREISFTATAGEVFTLCGPSGSGKTTILRTVAGLISSQEGDILLKETSIIATPIKDRNIFLLQLDFALHSNKTAYQNLYLGLRYQKTPKHEIKEKIMQASQKAGVDEILYTKVKRLTPIQKLQISLMRLCLRRIDLILVDDPFLSFNPQDTKAALGLLVKTAQQLNVPLVYSTIDSSHVAHLNVKTAILKEGTIVAIDHVHNLTQSPPTDYVKNILMDS